MSIEIINEVIGGKYDILSEIGSGGSSIVYLAKKLKTNERYAIKTISTEEKDSLKLLEREIKTLKRLNHSSIVRFIEDGYEQRHNFIYLVLEYLDGVNIKTYFDQGVDIKTKIDLLLQILDAISHAHSKEVIHRDIKPENIMVVQNSEQPLAKVLDFGISIITTTILTNTIRRYHTPLFAAPEQIQLQGVSRDSDIYSLGMTFLYLLSASDAKNDFRENQNKNFLYESALASLNATSNHGESLIEVLKRATDTNRENRPKIDEIRKPLESIKDDLSGKLTVVFSLTPNLKDKISDLNKYDGQSLKVKRDVESKLQSNSNIIHIIRIKGEEGQENRLTVEIGVEATSYIYRGFINRDKPDEIVLFAELNFVNPQQSERLFSNGIAVKINPIINVGSSSPRIKKDLSELINQLLQKDQQVQNEIESSKGVDNTFSRWQSVIEIEEKIINERKRSFSYSNFEYDRENQRLIITLKNSISLDEFEQITSPPLPVTISIKQQSPPYRESQWSVGNIIDGDKSRNAEIVEKLQISIAEFRNLDVFELILEKGKIETDFKAQESEIGRRRKALRAIKYGDSENATLCKVISDPSSSQAIEPLLINRFFNEQLDISQQAAVCKALATEDIFLIQGPPGTGKTSVITEIVLRILTDHPSDKVLISSQSNIAVDNVLTKLSSIKLDSRDVRVLRIGREEKIEEDARKFEIEKAIINWQESIRFQSSNHWQEYENQHDEMLLGVKKLSDIESIKTLSQQVQHISENITQAVNIFNSELFISIENTSSQQAADHACEMIYEKLLIEEKVLGQIKEYVEKFGIEYPDKKILSHWIDQEYKRLQSILGDNNENYEKFLKLRKLKEEWNEKLKRKQIDLVSIFLDGVNVVGATCLGIANLKDFKFDWVIVDEAGRSTAPETFVPMTRGKKIILVGDHQQLPPIIDRELQTRALGEKDIEKQVLETSLFEYLYNELPKSNKITLNHQYRMHPDIGNLVSDLFYKGKVLSERVDTNTKLHQFSKFSKSVYWVSTSDVTSDKSKERKSGTSYSNSYEANLIKSMLNQIQHDYQSSNIHKEVGIIAGYASQISVLEATIAPHDKNLWNNLDIAIHTVDAFQGRECDIIIYDLVRNNQQKYLGFTSDYRRLNVALSRAKQLLIIVGNDVMAYEGRTPNKLPNPFENLIEYIDSNPKVCERLVSSDFIK